MANFCVKCSSALMSGPFCTKCGSDARNVGKSISSRADSVPAQPAQAKVPAAQMGPQSVSASSKQGMIALWHGNVVLHDGKRTDVGPPMQTQMETVDMVPDNPGIWMFRCHIDGHMDAGMATLYKVEP